MLPRDTRLVTQGSTGGSGLPAVEGEHRDKGQASVLYLDRFTGRLQAWDELTLGGLGLSKAEVSRHLPEEVQPGSPPSRPCRRPRLRPRQGPGRAVEPGDGPLTPAPTRRRHRLRHTKFWRTVRASHMLPKPAVALSGRSAEPLALIV